MVVRIATYGLLGACARRPDIHVRHPFVHTGAGGHAPSSRGYPPARRVLSTERTFYMGCPCGPPPHPAKVRPGRNPPHPAATRQPVPTRHTRPRPRPRAGPDPFRHPGIPKCQPPGHSPTGRRGCGAVVSVKLARIPTTCVLVTAIDAPAGPNANHGNNWGFRGGAGSRGGAPRDTRGTRAATASGSPRRRLRGRAEAAAGGDRGGLGDRQRISRSAVQKGRVVLSARPEVAAEAGFGPDGKRPVGALAGSEAHQRLRLGHERAALGGAELDQR